MVKEQLDQRADADLVVAELLASEQRAVLIGDVNVVPVAGPVDPADCAEQSQASPDLRSDEISLSRKENENKPAARQGEVAL